MAQLIAEESLLREPNLWVPGKMPVGRVRLDGLKITDNLANFDAGLWLYNNNEHNLNGTDAAKGVATGTCEVTAKGIKASGSGRYLYTDQKASSVTDQTIVVVATLHGYGGGGFGRLWSSYGAVDYDTLFVRSSSPYLRYNSIVNGASYFNSITFDFGVPYVFVITQDAAATDIFGYVGRAGTGIQDSFSETYAFDSRGTQMKLLNRGSNDRVFDGLIHMYINDHTHWSESRIDAFIRDPYGIVIPA